MMRITRLRKLRISDRLAVFAALLLVVTSLAGMGSSVNSSSARNAHLAAVANAAQASMQSGGGGSAVKKNRGFTDSESLISGSTHRDTPRLMSTHWNDSQPIYWQLKERTIAMILDGTLAEGEALPSVRTVASEFQLNPITVSKSYQALVDDDLVEKRRGLGMFVRKGARKSLVNSESNKFLNEEWPAMLNRIDQLGLSIEDLFEKAINKESDS